MESLSWSLLGAGNQISAKTAEGFAAVLAAVPKISLV
jgi:hypothetical protein